MFLWGCGGVVIAVFVAIIMGLIDAALGIKSPKFLTPNYAYAMTIGPAALVIILAIAAAVSTDRKRIAREQAEFPRQLDEYRRSFLCRRCGQSFLT